MGEGHPEAFCQELPGVWCTLFALSSEALPLTVRPGGFCCGRGPVLCRVSSSILGLHPLDARNTLPPSVTTKLSPDIAWCSPGAEPSLADKPSAALLAWGPEAPPAPGSRCAPWGVGVLWCHCQCHPVRAHVLPPMYPVLRLWGANETDLPITLMVFSSGAVLCPDSVRW